MPVSPARSHPLPRLAFPVLLLGLGLPWAVFFGLLLAVLLPGGPAWDVPILLFLHRHATPSLDALAVFLTAVGNTGPMVGLGLLMLLVLLVRREWRRAWVFGLSVGGSMMLTLIIKVLVQRPRPALWVSIRPEHSYSFPSGHAMDTAAIATALGFLAWRHRGQWWVWILAPAFSLAVGWSRLYLGVHNPSDVLAGWSSAVGWVVLMQVLARLVRPTPRH